MLSCAILLKSCARHILQQKKNESIAIFAAIFNNTLTDIFFRATVAGMTVFEYDVISVVHVSGDTGNHFSVFFCNLHCVEHSTLVFSDKVLNISIDRHSLVRCKRLDNVFHSFWYCKMYSLIMFIIKIFFIVFPVHIPPHYIRLIASSSSSISK